MNHDVTYDRWVCSEKQLPLFFIQALDVKRGQGFASHWKMNVREGLSNAQNCSELQSNMC